MTFKEIGASLVGVALSFALLQGSAAIFAAILAILAVYIASVDIDRFVIPDLANGAMFAAGLALVFIDAPAGQIGSAFGDALIRTAGAGGALLGLRFLYRRTVGIEGLGMGDAKLAAAGAPWLSWPLLPIALLIAAVAALLVTGSRAARRGERIDRRLALPFGAFLAPAIWLTFLLERIGFLGN